MHSRGITIGSAECLQTLFDAITTNRAEMIERTFSFNEAKEGRSSAVTFRRPTTSSPLGCLTRTDTRIAL